MPIDPPGQKGLTGELDSLRAQVRELSRRSDNNVRPICVVRLASDVTAWYPLNRADIVVYGEWSATPDADPRGMWHYYPPNDAYVELPMPGRYRIMVNSRWEKTLAFDPANPGIQATSILLNGTDPVGNAIATATAYHVPVTYTEYPLICEQFVLSQGGRLRFSFWTRHIAAEIRLKAVATHFVVMYLGPT